MSLRLATLALLVFAACEDSSDGTWVPTDGRAEGNLPVDAGSGFLSECDDDNDCTGGRVCRPIGDRKRCTRACNETSPCPDLEGWSCTEGVCACTPGERSKECGVDKDCDGKPEAPVSAEVCNGKDDDCNDIIDDVVEGAQGAKLFYRDKDGDGFGDADKTAWLCGQVGGWVANLGDCADDRKEDNPDAEEICGDPYDNDCDGKLEDPDKCGLAPISCPAGKEVTDGECLSATLAQCGDTPGVSAPVDITEILFKQDAKRLKFTLRLVGSPSAGGCSAYTLGFGEPGKDPDLVYVYRLPADGCSTAGLAELEVFDFKNQQSLKSTVVPGKLLVPVGDAGHVSFIIDKSELFAHVPDPTYQLKACTVEKASSSTELKACDTDSCQAIAHR